MSQLAVFLSDLQRFELAIQLKETENIDNFTSDNMNEYMGG